MFTDGGDGREEIGVRDIGISPVGLGCLDEAEGGGRRDDREVDLLDVVPVANPHDHGIGGGGGEVNDFERHAG